MNKGPAYTTRQTHVTSIKPSHKLRCARPSQDVGSLLVQVLRKELFHVGVWRGVAHPLSGPACPRRLAGLPERVAGSAASCRVLLWPARFGLAVSHWEGDLLATSESCEGGAAQREARSTGPGELAPVRRVRGARWQSLRGSPRLTARVGGEPGLQPAGARWVVVRGSGGGKDFGGV